MQTTLKDVSIIVPCAQEVKHIRKCIESIRSLNFTGVGQWEILVADGMSEDGTRDIVHDMARQDSRIRLLVNPKVVTACGLNIGIKAARYRYIVRCDAHTEYDRDYIVNGLAALQKSCADVAGGPWFAEGRTGKGRAIAAVFQNGLFALGARAHQNQYTGPADTVYLGFYPKETFDRFGLFDEEILRNEDDEFNFRVNKRGGKVWLDSSIRSRYFVRDDYSRLIQQYRQYGYWKLGIILKHRRHASLRHYLPYIVLAAILGLSVGSLAKPTWFWGFPAALCFYIVYTIVVSAIVARAKRDLRIDRYWCTMVLMQGSYCLGVWLAVLDRFVIFSYPRNKYRKLTR